MRVAALDLGSNTFLLLIADMEGENFKKIILDETRVTRLGQGIHQNREFHSEALVRAEATLKEFSALIKQNHCEKVVAVATSAARDARNGSLLLEMGLRYGIPIQIISGDQEAAITYDGATADLLTHSGAQVIDVGGGSTEVIGPSDGKLRGCSLDIGSVRLTEMFLPQHPCSAADLEKLKAYIDEKIFEKRDRLPQSEQRIIAVAGTPTTLAGIELQTDFDEVKIHKYELTTKKIWAWRDKLAAMSIEERQKIPGMQPKRADVLVAGATILAATTEALGGDRVVVSTKGVRYGVARAWQKL